LCEAVRLEGGTVELQDGEARFRTVPPSWEKLVKSSLLLAKENNAQPKMVFSPSRLEENVKGLIMFRPRRDVRLITLSHPLMTRATLSFRRKLWSPPSESRLNRFTIECAHLPEGAESVAVVTFTMLARNELGERFREGMAHVAFSKTGKGWQVLSEGGSWARVEGSPVQDVRSVMQEVRTSWSALRSLTEKERSAMTSALYTIFRDELSGEWERSKAELTRLFRQRKDALRLDRTKYIEKLRAEYAKAEENAKQLTFSEDLNEERRQHYEVMKTKLSEANWESERANIEHLLKRLEAEERRMLEKVLPRRYSMGRDGVLMQVAAVKVLVKEGR